MHVQQYAMHNMQSLFLSNGNMQSLWSNTEINSELFAMWANSANEMVIWVGELWGM